MIDRNVYILTVSGGGSVARGDKGPRWMLALLLATASPTCHARYEVPGYILHYQTINIIPQPRKNDQLHIKSKYDTTSTPLQTDLRSDGETMKGCTIIN